MEEMKKGMIMNEAFNVLGEYLHNGNDHTPNHVASCVLFDIATNPAFMLRHNGKVCETNDEIMGWWQYWKLCLNKSSDVRIFLWELMGTISNCTMYMNGKLFETTCNTHSEWNLIVSYKVYRHNIINAKKKNHIFAELNDEDSVI